MKTNFVAIDTGCGPLKSLQAFRVCVSWDSQGLNAFWTIHLMRIANGVDPSDVNFEVTLKLILPVRLLFASFVADKAYAD